MKMFEIYTNTGTPSKIFILDPSQTSSKPTPIKEHATLTTLPNHHRLGEGHGRPTHPRPSTVTRPN